MLETLQPFLAPTAPFGPSSTAFLILTALLIDAYVGGLSPSFDRNSAFDRVLDGLDRRLNRQQRSQGARVLRGGVVMIVLVLAAAAVGVALTIAARTTAYGWCIELVALVVLLSHRRPIARIARVRRALERESLESARDVLRRSTRRDTSVLDRHAVARAAVELGADGFASGAVGPLMWYAIAGLSGLFAFVVVRQAARRFAFQSPHYRAFGWAAGWLAAVFQAVPSRLAGIMLALAAIAAPGASLPGAVRVLASDRGKARTAADGWPLAATAGALGLALAGPRRYPEETVRDPWIGERGTAMVTPLHLRKAAYLLTVAGLLDALLVIGVALLRLQLEGALARLPS